MVNIYGAYIEADLGGMTVVQIMAREMQQLGIPSLPLIMVTALLDRHDDGRLDGIRGYRDSRGRVLSSDRNRRSSPSSDGDLSYVSGFMGTMLSPLHVCMIVTSEYYRTDLVKSYRPIIIPALLQIVFGFIYMMVLRGMF
jgi:hypothetical protein